MNPFGGPLTREERLTATVVTLLENMREAIHMLDAMGKDFSANDVMAQIAALETAAGSGNVAVYGGYDTNDVRRWNALFASFNTWKAGNITTTHTGEG